MNLDKRSVKQQAKAGGRRARPWLERLARLGFLAKGLVYATVGALALQAAFGVGGQTTDTQGAVAILARAPFGRVLLVVLSVGLVAYGLWRFVQAGTNPGGRSGAKGVVARAGFVASGTIHFALAATAVGLLVGSSGGGGNTEQSLTAGLLAAVRAPLLAAGFVENAPPAAEPGLAAQSTFSRGDGSELLVVGVLDRDEERTLTLGGRVRAAAP